MKGWRISSWIFLLVGALNPSTLELRFQGRGRRCWLINFVHFERGVGVEFPIGPFGIQHIKRILGGLLAGISFCSHRNKDPATVDTLNPMWTKDRLHCDNSMVLNVSWVF